MCGIAGLFDTRPGARPGPELVDRRCSTRSSIAVRTIGHVRRGHAVLGVRRLKIIDLEGGHQPLSNEDGTVWVVYNGEIYNHAAVQQELEAERAPFRDALRYRGHRARVGGVRRDASSITSRACSGSQSGTADSSTLVVGRDRLGIKPVYYHWDGCTSAVRLGDQSRYSRPALCRQRAGSSRALSVRRLRVRPGTGDDVQGHPEAAGRASAVRRPGRTSMSGSTGTFASRPQDRSEDEYIAGIRRLLGEAVREAADVGRPARRVPVWRARFDGRAGLRAAGDHAASSDLHDRLRGSTRSASGTTRAA